MRCVDLHLGFSTKEASFRNPCNRDLIFTTFVKVVCHAIGYPSASGVSCISLAGMAALDAAHIGEILLQPSAERGEADAHGMAVVPELDDVHPRFACLKS